MQDLVQICRSLRTGCGFYRFKNLRLLEVTGADRKKLLHGLLANDVEGVAAGFGNLTHLLDPKGKIQAACEMYVLPEAIWLVCDAKSCDVLKKNIALRIFRSDVKITERSEAFGFFGFYGPKLPEQPLTQEYQHQKIFFSGADVFMARVHELGEVGYRVLVEANQTQKLLSGAAGLPDIVELNDDAFDTLSMEAGVPRFGVDFTTDNFSLEVNLNKAVSNSKGCYLGQEPVARLLSRGHVAQRLVGMVIDGEFQIAPHTEVFAGDKSIGEVTRCRFSPTLGKTICNAMLKYAFLESEAESAVVDGKTAQLVELPYVKNAPVNFLAGGPRAERVVGPQSRTRPKGERG